MRPRRGFALRYRTNETDDGLSGKEGTFLICSYWLVSALSVVGEQHKARDLFERLLRIASPLGLYAEEFEVDTGFHLGNFPQAFSDRALIEAAGRIIDARGAEAARPPAPSSAPVIAVMTCARNIVLYRLLDRSYSSGVGEDRAGRRERHQDDALDEAGGVDDLGLGVGGHRVGRVSGAGR